MVIAYNPAITMYDIRYGIRLLPFINFFVDKNSTLVMADGTGGTIQPCS